MDVIRQPVPGQTEGRPPRADGDALHFAAFGLILLALTTVAAADDAIVRWFVGEPPRELRPMSNGSLLREFCCLPDPSVRDVGPYVDGWKAGPDGFSDDELARIAAATGQYVRSLNTADRRVGMVGRLAGMLLLGLVASRVAYRFRDMFMVFIPIYGVIFIVQMAWRISSPVPYWERPPHAKSTRRFWIHLVGALLVNVAIVVWGLVVWDWVSPY